MVMTAYNTERVLVKLTDVTQELMVGIGSANASVRTLTAVSLEIRSGELVVLSGNRGAGERALLSVIAGDRRGVTGSCEVLPQTRIRSLRITASAALALTQEWQRAEALTQISSDVWSPEKHRESYDGETRQYAELHEALRRLRSDQPPDLILLDVVPEGTDRGAGGQPATQPGRVAESRVPRLQDTAQTSGGVRPWNEKNRSALLAWAAVCRLRGGAVVMAAGDAFGGGIIDTALNHVRENLPESARGAATVRELRLAASTVRVVPMHSGRLAASVRLRTNDLAS